MSLGHFIFAVEEETQETSGSIIEEIETPDEAIEKIKVTGSRIKRIDLEYPRPVSIFSKEDWTNSGYLSVSRFLKNTRLPFKNSRGGLYGGDQKLF